MHIRRRSLIGLAPIGLLGCSTGPNQVTGFRSGNGEYTQIPPAQRERVELVKGTTLDGKPLDLADYLGHVIVINVWGSWCAPCRHEAPQLVEAAKRATQARFVGINTRDLDVAQAQAFVRAFNISYPNLFDPKGELLLRFKQLPPTAIPSTLIIDKQGRSAARILGEASWSTIVGAIEEAS